MNEVLIVGTGALATLFAAGIAATGTQVTMLGTWREGLVALKEQGARLMTRDGLVRNYPVQVIDSPSKQSPTRHALVLVKSWQTERAAEQLGEYLAADGLAVTLQNGLGNAEILGGKLGLERVCIGVTTTGATLLEPGLARLGGEGNVSLEIHPKLTPLVAVLEAGGFNVKVVENAQSLLWGKLVINAAINPLTAILRLPNGELLERPAVRLLMGELATEAAAVAAAHGVDLPFDDPIAAVEDVARRTSANYSSMLQDVMRGARTEIDAICGAVLRKGNAKGVAVPVNRTMVHLIEAMSSGKENS